MVRYEDLSNLISSSGITMQIKCGSGLRQFVRKASTIQNIDYANRSLKLPDGAVVFSLIQPTGKFHLGNYLGAVRVWTELSEDAPAGGKCIFGTADLHAITIPKPDGNAFRQMRHEAIASLLAVGIDPTKSILFHQSQVPEHAELCWYLSTLTSMGALNRMTQWKTKANIKDTSSEKVGAVKLGLFTYPVLQAADVLLYKSTHIPVGEDQVQQLELTRQLAQAFNSTYKTRYFREPTTLLTPTRKVLSLQNPLKKMSKSDANQNSCICVTDEPDAIRRKIRSAVTDSIGHEFKYDPEGRPGVSNLINIVAGIQKKTIAAVEADIAGFKDHATFKNYVTDILVAELRGPREEFARYMNDKSYIYEVERSGAERAGAIAAKTLAEVRAIMGY
ncbi:FACR089Cp [Eremothecium gossypii FDAG1]|nr:FACR089Cp [Eremothecium gossypii FDAG1]